jgi:hypothetical protein
MSTSTDLYNDLYNDWEENEIFDTLHDLRTNHTTSGLARYSLRPNQESLIETVLFPVKRGR